MSIGNEMKSAMYFNHTDVNMMPGYTVPPTTRPSGYHDSESYQFQKPYAPFSNRNLVDLKLNQGSYSWMTDSNFMTEKVLAKKDRAQIAPKIIT